MKSLEEKLEQYEGGRILDVATSYGDFIRFLTDTFQSYIEAIGVDLAEDRLKEAQEKPGYKIIYNPMNAEKLAFEDNYFDTVAMRHSMHHLSDIDKVLSEMKRVLKDNGLFILGEMFQDPKTEKPNSQRHWHHWRAEVDRLFGEPHNETLTKDEIIKAVEKLNLKDVEIFDEREENPDADMTKFMLANISESLPKLKDMGGQDDLISRGEKIEKIMKESSYAPEGAIYILARK